MPEIPRKDEKSLAGKQLENSIKSTEKQLAEHMLRRAKETEELLDYYITEYIESLDRESEGSGAGAIATLRDVKARTPETFEKEHGVMQRLAADGLVRVVDIGNDGHEHTTFTWDITELGERVLEFVDREEQEERGILLNKDIDRIIKLAVGSSFMYKSKSDFVNELINGDRGAIELMEKARKWEQERIEKLRRKDELKT